MSGVVIVGAGLAGARCAESLRAGGYDRPVTLVGAERVAPYERPALSKELLAGDRSPDEILLRPPRWWAEHEVDLRLGSAVDGIDARRRTALVGKHELTWDHLVLATGARARSLPGLPPSAHVLRTLADALAVRSRLVPGTRLTVLGAGLIGAEVASTAIALGCEVTLVDAAPAPLTAPLGREAGSLLAERWRSQGARLHLGKPVASVKEAELELVDGTVLAHDVLLVAIGAEPAGELAGAAGPITTDACGRTSRPHVYACGDAAAFGGVRAEHWTTAGGQAATVARAILGELQPYRELPYFWSDQFGLRLQMVGDRASAVSLELDGADDSFSIRYLDGQGRPVAVLLANRPAGVASARRELAAAA